MEFHVGWTACHVVESPVPFNYATNGETIAITGYTGTGGTVTIPNMINFLPVTGVGDWAFNGCTTLTNLVFPDSLTTIGSYSFGGCSSLTNVTIPNSVSSIGEGAFAGTSLANVILPNGITRIEDDTFSWCPNLTGVAIPASVTYIGNYAFAYCTSLTTVTIGNGIASIGNYTFYRCTSLMSVYFQGNAPTYGPNVFVGDANATVYYLPGTRGWGATFGGTLFGGTIFGALPTVLWNPQVQTAEASFGVQGNQFGFAITGNSNLVVVVEACTNLANADWCPVATNTLINGSSFFGNPQWTNYSDRYYRLRLP